MAGRAAAAATRPVGLNIAEIVAQLVEHAVSVSSAEAARLSARRRISSRDTEVGRVSRSQPATRRTRRLGPRAQYCRTPRVHAARSSSARARPRLQPARCRSRWADCVDRPRIQELQDSRQPHDEGPALAQPRGLESHYQIPRGAGPVAASTLRRPPAEHPDQQRHVLLGGRPGLSLFENAVHGFDQDPRERGAFLGLA